MEGNEPRTRVGRNAKCPACEQPMNYGHAQQVASLGRTVTCTGCGTRYRISVSIEFETQEVRD